MNQTTDSGFEALVEQVIASGTEEMGPIFEKLFNLAMRIERERFLSAGAYERSDERVGYANGFKPKRVDTPVGSMTVAVPKTRKTEHPFYPQSLERGRRSTRAVMSAITEMYIKGVSTREVEDVLEKFGIKGLSSSQVSRANKLLDEELDKWRHRRLGEYLYVFLDARYEKVRDQGVVRDAAVLSAIGVDEDGRRRVLGVSCALSEAEVHWRSFLDSLVARGLRGVQFIVSDDHAGLRAARRAVFPGVPWQRCQFHLSANAIQHAPTVAIRRGIGAKLREIWNASSLQRAEMVLKDMAQEYRDKAPKLSTWLEENVPEGLTVFSLPEEHRRRLRTSNPIERCIQQELKRRTRKIRVFPSEDSLLRLVTALLVEIDEAWETSTKIYINWGSAK